MAKAAVLTSRAVTRVGGPDARSFLAGLITQEPPAPGAAAFAELLSPQGKILFDFLIAAVADGFVLDCHGEGVDAHAKRLSQYKLRANVIVERLADWAVCVFWENGASSSGDATTFFDPRLPALGHRAIGPRATIAAIANDVGEIAWERHRIALGVPEFGKDFSSDEVFLLDVNYDALGGVSYKKGCFVGQEVTSRMKRKGEVRKRTARLSFDGAAPAKGTPVTAGDSTLGEVLSGADGAALGLIRMDRLASAQGAGQAIEAAGKTLRIGVPAYLERG
jgi:folate-binding protein YgfZ